MVKPEGCIEIDGDVLFGPGVYLLLSRGVVVYIGQSKVLLRRIYTHANRWNRLQLEGVKKSKLAILRGEKVISFDAAWAMPCKLGDLNRLEAEMIAKYDPKHNVLLKPSPAFTHRPDGFALNVGGVMLAFKSLAPEFVRRI